MSACLRTFQKNCVCTPADLAHVCGASLAGLDIMSLRRIGMPGLSWRGNISPFSRAKFFNGIISPVAGVKSMFPSFNDRRLIKGSFMKTISHAARSAGCQVVRSRGCVCACVRVLTRLGLVHESFVFKLNSHIFPPFTTLSFTFRLVVCVCTSRSLLVFNSCLIST